MPATYTADVKPDLRPDTTTPTRTPTKRKREPEPEREPDPASSQTAPPSPSPSKSRKRPPAPAVDAPSYAGYTDKQRYAMLLFDFAVKNLSKAEAQAATGLSADQQKQLTRAGKGSLRRAYEAFMEGL